MGKHLVENTYCICAALMLVGSLASSIKQATVDRFKFRGWTDGATYNIFSFSLPSLTIFLFPPAASGTGRTKENGRGNTIK